VTLQEMPALDVWPVRRPIVIAHRAANELSRIRAAEAAGADLLEADVWMYRGALEVRHLKTVRGLPVLWDRWRLSMRLGPRLSLDVMLAELGPLTGIMLDLKGNDAALADAVLAALDKRASVRRAVVCSQNWRMLEAFAGRPDLAIVHSIGGRRRLRRVMRCVPTPRINALAVHARFLDGETVQALHRVAPILLTWPINDERRLQDVLAYGVDGVISDNVELLAQLVRNRETPAKAAHR
jgi:glycerophosphoryl diester phosphodiesterase